MARRKRATKPKAKARSRTTNIVVARTRHHGKRRSTKRAVRGTVGSTVGRTHPHKRRRRKSSGGIMGFTTAGLKMKDGLMMVLGVGGAIVVNHKAIKPLEAKVMAIHPGWGVLLGIVHTGLGFAIAVKGKHMAMKAAGVTLMTGGVNSLIRTSGIEKHIPGISGANHDWTTVKIPISGPGEFKSMVAGLLDNNKSPNWGMVSGDHGYNHAMTYSNSQMPGKYNNNQFSSQVAETELEDYTMNAKG